MSTTGEEETLKGIYWGVVAILIVITVYAITLGLFINYKMDAFTDETILRQNEIKVLAGQMKANQLNISEIEKFLHENNGYSPASYEAFVE